MFEKYTENARRAIFFARWEASQFGSPYIETEHLLLGLLREDKAFTSRLLRPAESIQEIRAEIERCTEKREKIATSVDLPLSHENKRALACAAEEAERLGHKHIGTEHLFLGLLREEKCFAAKLLLERNVTLEKIRGHISGQDIATPAAAREVRRSTVSISEFGADLTTQALDNTLPPLIGRERELQQTIQILCRCTRGNPVLVGEPGVGKKTIVYGLAHHIVESATPELEGKSIVSLDLEVIASGTRSRSRFEDNLDSILRDMLYGGQSLILFIDGLHTLANQHRFLNFANIIKPALIKRSLQCISTATSAEYAQTVAASPWMEQHFTVVEVKPPSEAEAIEVLTGVKDRFQKFHGVIYSDEAIRSAVFHANTYFPNRYLPEKAIDLMDEAGARVKLRQPGLPDEIAEVQKRIKSIVHLMEAAIANREFEKARAYSEEERKERDNLSALTKRYARDDSAGTVTREEIEQIVAGKTGVSLDFLRNSKLPAKP